MTPGPDEVDEVEELIRTARRRADLVEVAGFVLAAIVSLAVVAVAVLVNVAYIRWVASW